MGDIVTQKSGDGTLMTVTRIARAAGACKCAWIENGKARSASYRISELLVVLKTEDEST